MCTAKEKFNLSYEALDSLSDKDRDIIFYLVSNKYKLFKYDDNISNREYRKHFDYPEVTIKITPPDAESTGWTVLADDKCSISIGAVNVINLSELRQTINLFLALARKRS